MKQKKIFLKEENKLVWFFKLDFALTETRVRIDFNTDNLDSADFLVRIQDLYHGPKQGR